MRKRGDGMRSDERLFFYVASGAMTISIVYTLFFHILPILQERHSYVYGHCTITGAPHWEKYETLGGIKERVIVPVELRIGTYQDALSWNQWNATGTKLLKSSDIYHQGIARDEPSGWEFFSIQDKDDYLAQYGVGREYECWARPSTGFHEVTFRTHATDMKRLIPQVIFLVIVVGLCLATGVCVGVMDHVRAFIGLPPPTEADLAHKYDHRYDRDIGAVGGSATQPAVYGTSYGSTGGPPMRQFAADNYDSKKDREWV